MLHYNPFEAFEIYRLGSYIICGSFRGRQQTLWVAKTAAFEVKIHLAKRWTQTAKRHALSGHFAPLQATSSHFDWWRKSIAILFPIAARQAHHLADMWQKWRDGCHCCGVSLGGNNNFHKTFAQSPSGFQLSCRQLEPSIRGIAILITESGATFAFAACLGLPAMARCCLCHWTAAIGPHVRLTVKVSEKSERNRSRPTLTYALPQTFSLATPAPAKAQSSRRSGCCIKPKHIVFFFIIILETHLERSWRPTFLGKSWMASEKKATNKIKTKIGWPKASG